MRPIGSWIDCWCKRKMGKLAGWKLPRSTTAAGILSKLAIHWQPRGQRIIGKVGQATAQLMRSRHLVDLACELMAGDPYYFLCPPGQCQFEDECDEARSYNSG